MASDNEETTDDAPLSMSDAVRALTASEAPAESDKDQPADDEAQQDDDADDELPSDEDGEDEGEEDGEEDQADDDDADDEADADDEDDSEQGRFVADDARVKLADGTFTTVAELKAGSLKSADYTQKTQALAEKERNVQHQSEQLQQLRQANEEIRDFTIAVLEKYMPKAPDDALYSTDLVKAMEMERDYKTRKEELDYLKAQREWDQQQVAKQSGEEAREKSNAEWAKLVDAIPALKDPDRGKALVTGMLAYGQKHGYSEQEVRSALAFDHRQGVILHKAMAYDRLQEKKAKIPAKVEGRPPVVRSGKRLNAKGSANREARVAMNRLNETGSIKDGVRALLALQKG